MGSELREDAARVVGDRYILGQRLGAGGMGVVYEAEDQLLGSTVAVKLLNAHDTSDNAVARLQREARSAAKLGHPNIVRVLDLGKTDDGAFLVMENLTGETLDQRLARIGPLPARAAVRVHVQLLAALQAAHEAGVLHRDIKPSNIFLTSLADGSELVKLLDFGLAYLLEEASSAKLTATGIAMGTPAYMAPERIKGDPQDARSDLYSVGVSFYESLTGDLPFFAHSAMALRGQILLKDAPNLADKRPELGPGLAWFLQRALAKDPAERHASAREMSDALREAARSITKMGSVAQQGPQRPRAVVQPTERGIGPTDDRDLGTSETLASMPISGPAEIAAHTARGHADPALLETVGAPSTPSPAQATPPLDGASVAGPATPPLGGASVTNQPRISHEPVPPRGSIPGTRSSLPSIPTRGIPAWLVGVSMGAAVGAVLLLVLWIWHTTHRTTSPRAPEAAIAVPPEPAPVADSVEVTTPEASPAVETAATQETEASHTEASDSEASDSDASDTDDGAPVEAEPAAPTRAVRRRPRRPVARPDPTPAPTPTPAPRLQIGGPLEPDWNTPPP